MRTMKFQMASDELRGVRAHLDTVSGSLSPSDGERVGERGFELANKMPPLPPCSLSLLLHPMEEREKTAAVRGCVHRVTFFLLLALISLGGNVFAQTNKNIPGPADYAAFSRFVTERNIYDPARQPHYSASGRRPTTRPRTRSSAAAPTIALVGTMAYEKGTFAFFSSNDSEQKKVLPVAAKIAGYKIVEILPSAVMLEAADKKPFAMRVGEVLRQETGGWQLAGQGDVPAGGATATNSSSMEKSGESGESKPSAAAGEPNDVLKRLMEKREKENK